MEELDNIHNELEHNAAAYLCIVKLELQIPDNESGNTRQSNHHDADSHARYIQPRKVKSD